MATVGEKLREARIRWGLSLREVKERSEGLAKAWGSRSYEISSSWLARLERGTHEMTVPKLISLATIYSKTPEELLREYHPEPARLPCPESVSGPNVTLLVTVGRLDTRARQLLPDNFVSRPIPEETVLAVSIPIPDASGMDLRSPWAWPSVASFL